MCRRVLHGALNAPEYVAEPGISAVVIVEGLMTAQVQRGCLSIPSAARRKAIDG